MFVRRLQHKYSQGYEQLTDDHLCVRHTAHRDTLDIHSIATACVYGRPENLKSTNDESSMITIMEKQV